MFVFSSRFSAWAAAAAGVLSWVAAGSPLRAAASPMSTEPDPQAVEFFEKKVRPVLVGRCYLCHSAETKNAGGLRVDDLNGLLTGGDSGPAVIPGDAANSLLLKRTRDKNPKRIMPQEGEHVTDEEYAALAKWINDGVAWPRERVPGNLGELPESILKLKETHWAWQPLREPEVPAVQNEAWAKHPVDRFVLAKLEANQLVPVGDAPPAQALRRLYYDLTGLPPTPEELHAFLQNPTEDAWVATVDRLLASRAYAEQWARHWLDVARYAESTGPSRNIPYPHAWRYRDYVINALAWDIPFDRFIQEQIAGDLLPAYAPAERDRLVTATGFLALGVKDVNQRFKERFQMDHVDEKIDVTTRAFLALTVSCARCHDHKTDPISVKDYYALAGIFTSTEDGAGVRNKMGGSGLDYYVRDNLIQLIDRPEITVDPEVLAKKRAEVAEAKKAWDAIRGTPEGLRRLPNGQLYQRRFRLRYERLEAELQRLSDPVAQGYAVHGVREAAKVGDTPIRVRGEAERLGPPVPRGFLSTFEVPGAKPVNPEQSGRLELAQWLAHPNNPLTPRVIVNRVWQHLFGTGLVSTVDNFGVTGDVPSHPELLDYLASLFLKNGWSLKKLVRELVLTRAYRLSSEATPAHLEKDPANRLIWRHAPRRLQAEEIRDAMLHVAGRLETNPPQGSPAQKLPMIELNDNGAQAQSIRQAAETSRHRSLYLPLLRGITPPALEAFDPVEQTLVTGRRDATTVPAQALFLLNSPFVLEQALALAESILSAPDFEEEAALQRLYWRTLGREPSEAEIARAREFLASYEAAYVPAQLVEEAAPETVPVLAATTGASSDAAAEGEEEKPAAEAPPAPKTEPGDAHTAAWMALVQALFGSAEFRFVR